MRAGELQIVVRVAELLEVIIANRKNHQVLFSKAWDGYRRQAIDALEERLLAAKAGKPFQVWVNLKPPEDHTADYDEVIDMLSMHDSDTITIGQQDFAQYIRDDWGWKQQWLTTNSAYYDRG